MPKPTLRTVIRCDGVRQVRRDGKTMSVPCTTKFKVRHYSTDFRNLEKCCPCCGKVHFLAQPVIDHGKKEKGLLESAGWTRGTS